MEYCYPLMKDWVDFIDRGDMARGERKYLFDFMDTFGDWLALDGPTPTSFKGSTNDTFISSVYLLSFCTDCASNGRTFE